MSRLRIRRRPVLYWALTGALALVTALVVSSTVAAAREARAGYGTTRSVVVATHDIAPGATIEPGDTTLQERPLAVIPSGALTETPIGQVASAAILEGEPVVESRVAGHGMIPEGSIGIAVPLDAGDVGAGQSAIAWKCSRRSTPTRSTGTRRSSSHRSPSSSTSAMPR